MSDFLRALIDPDFPLLRQALAAALLASVAFGVVGSYVVVRRIGYIAGAISHCILGGIGAALYLRQVHGATWIDPMAGAVAAALISALVIGIVSMRARQREDTVIGALWALGMAVGLVFLARTPGYVDPMSYLFGNILLITRGDLWLVAGLDLLVVGISLFFYNPLLSVCFDEEYSRVRGLRVERYYLLLLCLIALTVVLLVKLVGIVLVIALLTLPSAVAGLWARRLSRMMVVSVVLCAAFSASGLGISYRLDLPSGPVMILLAGAVYLAALGLRRLVSASRRKAHATGPTRSPVEQ